jgi:deoxyinosine 3'endonuclease (endonuclease V)
LATSSPVIVSLIDNIQGINFDNGIFFIWLLDSSQNQQQQQTKQNWTSCRTHWSDWRRTRAGESLGMAAGNEAALEADHAVLEEWKLIQTVMSKQVQIPPDDSRTFSDLISSKAPKFIGGCDLSFFTEDPRRAVASLVICKLDDVAQVVWEKHLEVTLTEPYISQFLSFRELPGLLQVWNIFKTERPDLVDNLVLLMLDGNGILHPRKFGIAAHLGVVIQKPTMGVAKKLLWLPGFPSEKALRDRFKDEDLPCHAHLLLQNSEGDVVGAAVRATADSYRPIFVSPGHLISLPEALKIVEHTTLFRVPEPIRMADLHGRAAIRQIIKASNPNRRPAAAAPRGHQRRPH